MHLDRRAVAALVHRPAGQSGRSGLVEAVQQLPSTSSGGSRTSSPSSPTCGHSSRPTRRSAACSRTTATATPGATPMSASRRCCQKLGYTLNDPGPLPEPDRRFLGPDQRLQERQCRDHHRRDDPARLHHLLEPGQAAGLHAEDRLDRQGDPLPAVGRGARQHRQQPLVRGLVVAEPSVQVVADRRSRRPSSPRASPRPPAGPWTQPIGFVHALFELAVDVMKRRRRSVRQRGGGRGDRGDQARHASSGRSPGTAPTCRPSPPRTSPRRRWSAASGASRTAAATTSSSSTTRPRRTSRPAARWKPSSS